MEVTAESHTVDVAGKDIDNVVIDPRLQIDVGEVGPIGEVLREEGVCKPIKVCLEVGQLSRTDMPSIRVQQIHRVLTAQCVLRIRAERTIDTKKIASCDLGCLVISRTEFVHIHTVRAHIQVLQNIVEAEVVCRSSQRCSRSSFRRIFDASCVQINLSEPIP